MKRFPSQADELARDFEILISNVTLRCCELRLEVYNRLLALGTSLGTSEGTSVMESLVDSAEAAEGRLELTLDIVCGSGSFNEY